MLLLFLLCQMSDNFKTFYTVHQIDYRKGFILIVFQYIRIRTKEYWNITSKRAQRKPLFGQKNWCFQVFLQSNRENDELSRRCVKRSLGEEPN